MSGLYLHIPFCRSKCAYCDFYSIRHTPDIDSYIDALQKEFQSRKHEIGTHIDTIYLGGGTPSSLSIPQLSRLFEWLPTGTATEITIEVNPEDITDNFSRFLYSAPINRVSMGVQSLSDNELALVGRRHTSADTLAAYSRLRNAGIGNISLDLIFGLPAQTLESWQRSVDITLGLKPEHLSAYCLMLEPGTRLSAMAAAGKFEEQPQEPLEQMYLSLCRSTAAAGMNHYEISNFALPGFESNHNSAYWNQIPYLGLGAAAHSFDGHTRRANPASIKKYLANPTASYTSETLSVDELINEYLLLKMRTVQGLRLDEFSARFGTKATESLLERSKKPAGNGLLKSDPDRLYIPEPHWLTTDSVLLDLFT